MREVARAAAPKKFQDNLPAQVVQVKQDHCHMHKRSDVSGFNLEQRKEDLEAANRL